LVGVLTDPATDLEPGFRHEALLYAGEQGFLDGTVPFIRGAVQAREPILVVVAAEKIERLRRALAAEAEHVTFADMAQVGANPGRIIPAWQDFVNAHPGRALRGIGEPIDTGRGPVELVECHRHEALLNVAFADASDFVLLCPYDTETLDPAIVAEAQRTHPHVRHGDTAWESPGYAGLDAVTAPFDEPLPEPAGAVIEWTFDASRLAELRTFLTEFAGAAGMPPARVAELILAVTEIGANSARHGGGHGLLRVWREDARLICEVRDRGRIVDPLAGRRRPEPGQVGGYGLWLANKVCELVQIRTFADGSTVRLHVQL
jgi:anti-sigma regulatory factor (Ser/Thr protein kinase)